MLVFPKNVSAPLWAFKWIVVRVRPLRVGIPTAYFLPHRYIPLPEVEVTESNNAVDGQTKPEEHEEV